MQKPVTEPGFNMIEPPLNSMVVSGVTTTTSLNTITDSLIVFTNSTHYLFQYMILHLPVYIIVVLWPCNGTKLQRLQLLN